MSDISIEKIIEIVSVPPRLEIIRLLAKEDLTHTEIALQLGKVYGAWDHCHKLVQYGILIRRPISTKEVRYRLNKSVIQGIANLFAKLLED